MTTRRSLLLAAAALPCGLARGHAGLRARVEALARDQGVCAVAFATLSARRPDAAEFIATCAPAAGHDAESLFQAASLSKPVAAYGVLKLVEQGQIELDAPVTRYLADRIPADGFEQVTIRSLLNHTSGLPNWADGPLKLGFRPGSAWRYSGEGYMLLQKVVERVTGEGLERFLERQVMKPLGMTHSAWRWSDALAGRVLPGEPREMRFADPMAAASLYTTAGDYARFMAALLADEPLLRTTLAAAVAASTAPPIDWGLGWGIERTPQGPCLWHWGNNPGYRAFAMASVASGDGFVLLTAGERGLALAAPLAALVLPGEHPAFRSPMLR